EFVLAEDREGVAVEGEAEAGRRSGSRPTSDRALRLRADAEAVATVAGGETFRGGAVPADAVRGFRGDVFPVEGLDHFAGRVDDVDAQVVLRLGAADRVLDAGIAESEVEGLARGGGGGGQRQRAGARRRGGRPGSAARRRRAAAGGGEAAGRRGGLA